MRMSILILLLSVASAIGQGNVRRTDTIGELLSVNPFAEATRGKLSYLVERGGTNLWGGPRFAYWTNGTPLTPNATNVFTSTFGGQWIFGDRDAPIQDARWYGLSSNKWRITYDGSLYLGSTNVVTELASKANVFHVHSTYDITDITAAGRAIVTAVDAAAQRTALGLGNSAVLNTGTTAGTVALGDHNHTGVYDTNGAGTAAATDAINTHVAQADPHGQYVKEASGASTNQILDSATIQGTTTVTNIGSDLATGGAHRIMVRDATTYQLRPMTSSYLKGLLDIHASDIVGSGTLGRSILEAADVATFYGLTTTGTPTTNVWLRGDYSWSTIPSTPSPTNGIADAPADGVLYGRKDNAWTWVDYGLISGGTTFGTNWVISIGSASAGRTELGLDAMAVVADASSDNFAYGRRNAAWFKVAGLTLANTFTVYSEFTNGLSVSDRLVLNLNGTNSASVFGSSGFTNLLSTALVAPATSSPTHFFTATSDPSSATALVKSSTAADTRTALGIATNAYAILANAQTFTASNRFTIAPNFPTKSALDNSTNAATTAYVDSAVTAGGPLLKAWLTINAAGAVTGSSSNITATNLTWAATSATVISTYRVTHNIGSAGTVTMLNSEFQTSFSGTHPALHLMDGTVGSNSLDFHCGYATSGYTNRPTKFHILVY